MLKNVEFRKLPADVLCQVVNILEINDDWKRVMSIIPKKLQDENSGCKYNNEEIRLIEEDAKSNNQKCAEILMDEWGTSGRVRPTLSHLKDILIKAEIYRAADLIAHMLKEPLPKRPTHGPPAPITGITEILNEESLDLGFSNNMSFSNKDCNGTNKKMESVSDFIHFSENSTDEASVEKESQSDLIDFSEDTTTEEALRVMPSASKNFSQKSTSRLTSDSSDTESSFQSYSENTNQNYSKYDMNNYQQTFPDIPMSSVIETTILEDVKLNNFDYYELESITGNFSNELEDIGPKGLRGKIGSGGFGDVFVGKHQKYGMLAVKRAHSSHPNIHRRPDIAMKIFNAEVKFLSQFRHKNIVSIIGYSRNGPTPCIVCEYVDGGSLEKIIEAKELRVEAQRIIIMVGIAEGLKYLHTSEESLHNKDNADVGTGADSVSQKLNKKIIHGDVKTANILLTKDYVPKLCDFGVAKQYDATFMTTCFMGTSAYMAPEALQGMVTQKTDIFSYGIVLLELLTGLKPIINHNGCNYNIKHYVEENCTQEDITPLLDPIVETWKNGIKVYDLARCCFKYNWKNRPSITEVCNDLININSGTN
ncbi:unnamed protein product, partial [Brenthis ino]